ncbi:MFS transporter [Actinomyces sp.]|uniref:MFS transporter n=1 Tax=Actinomycetes TaxID=1760 RepID=UPI0029034B49|nr:MFS transporter [Actinomyces sp.]MDU1430841.1 MFS transporter [Actinomyces sp.]MDU5516568.1 MFS transporter [Cutibacterium avidum]
MRSTGKAKSEACVGGTLPILFAAVFVMWATMMSVFPALPMIARDYAMSASQLGSLFGVSSLLMTLMAPGIGVLADRVGRKWLITLGLLFAAMSVAVGALSAAALLGGWIAFGVARGMFLSPTFTVPADICPPSERGKAIGTLSAAIGLGSVTGYVLGGFGASAFGWRAVLVTDAALLVIAGLLCAVRLRETRPEQAASSLHEVMSDTKRWLSGRTLLVSGLVAMLAFTVGIASSFAVPFELTTLGASAQLVAIAFIPYEVVSAVSSILLGRLGDLRGRRRALLLAVALVLAALIALALLPASLWSVLTLYSLVGIAEGPIIGLCSAMVTDEVMRIDFRRIGAALGAQRLLSGLGAFLGPVLGGILIARTTSSQARFGWLAAGTGAAMLLALLLKETNVEAGSSK